MPEPPFEEIRRALRRELGRKRLRKGLWTDMVHSRYVQLVAEGRWTIQRLAQVYERREETLFPPTRPRREVVREVGPDKRAEALAQIVALEAEVMAFGVLDFRKWFLGGKLLPFEEIPRWIKEQAAAEGPPAPTYLSVPVAAENNYDPHILLHHSREDYAAWLEREAARVSADANCELPVGWRSNPQTLTFPAPRGRSEIINIRGDGTLALLKWFAYALSGASLFAGWAEQQSVAFILCGAIPRIPKARVSLKYAIVRAASHIDLEVSPRLAPKEVGAVYAEARSRFQATIDRPMDDKHLALAVFAQRTLYAGPLSGVSWRALRERWNSLHPEWHFATEDDPQARRFALEARLAWTRLTGETWPKARKRRPRPPRWIYTERCWY